MLRRSLCLLALIGCQSGSTRFSLGHPPILSQALATIDALSVTISFTGGKSVAPVTKALDTQSPTTEVFVELSPGSYNIDLQYFHTASDGSKIDLVDYVESVVVQAGKTDPLTIDPASYVTPLPDDDKDGVSNIDELLADTNPTSAAPDWSTPLSKAGHGNLVDFKGLGVFFAGDLSSGSAGFAMIDYQGNVLWQASGWQMPAFDPMNQVIYAAKPNDSTHWHFAELNAKTGAELWSVDAATPAPIGAPWVTPQGSATYPAPTGVIEVPSTHDSVTLVAYDTSSLPSLDLSGCTLAGVPFGQALAVPQYLVTNPSNCANHSLLAMASQRVIAVFDSVDVGGDGNDSLAFLGPRITFNSNTLFASNGISVYAFAGTGMLWSVSLPGAGTSSLSSTSPLAVVNGSVLLESNSRFYLVDTGGSHAVTTFPVSGKPGPPGLPLLFGQEFAAPIGTGNAQLGIFDATSLAEQQIVGLTPNQASVLVAGFVISSLPNPQSGQGGTQVEALISQSDGTFALTGYSFQPQQVGPSGAR